VRRTPGFVKRADALRHDAFAAQFAGVRKEDLWRDRDNTIAPTIPRAVVDPGNAAAMPTGFEIDGPNLVGVRGMGTEIGAGPSKGRGPSPILQQLLLRTVTNLQQSK
jgi:hypothetical protein